MHWKHNVEPSLECLGVHATTPKKTVHSKDYTYDILYKLLAHRRAHPVTTANKLPLPFLEAVLLVHQVEALLQERRESR